MDNYDKLLESLLDCGSCVHNLYIKKYNDSHRGIHAKNFIKKGEIILKIPLHCFVTDVCASNNEIINKIKFIKNLNFPVHSMLAFYIMLDSEKPDSRFTEYYDTLPKNLNNFPILWDETKLNLLEHSSILVDIKNRKQNMITDYDKITSEIKELSKFTLKQFMNYIILVLSRNFSISVFNKKVNALVPIADMANHDEEPNTTWMFEDTINSFIMVANKDILKEEIITDSYGIKSNYTLLNNYGFTLDSIKLQFFDAVLDGKSYKYSRTSKNFNIKNESLNLLKKYDHKLNEAQLLYQETKDDNFKNIINILKKEKELIENSYNEKIYKVSYEL